MALAKEKAPMVPGLDLSCLEQLVFKGQHSLMLEQEGFSQNYSSLLAAAPSFYDQGNQCMNMNSSLMFLETLNASSQEALPVINFKPGADHWNMHSNSSFLSFDQKISAGEDCVSWIDSMEHDYQMNVHNLKSSSDSHEIQGAGYGLMENRHGENRFEILYSSMSSGDDLEGISRKDQGLQKRQFLRGDIQASKKICGNSRKQAKAKSPPTSKDPQSIAARIRREKISERLKVLQDLVPNGTKVDLVTMLEKAISYVKFLQLQVKVLATDEFWPAQGGKAPEVSQVKDAIEAILSSHRGRNNN